MVYLKGFYFIMGMICRDKNELFKSLFDVMTNKGNYLIGGDREFEDLGEDEWEVEFGNHLYQFFDEYGDSRANIEVDLENAGVDEYCKGGLRGYCVAPGGGVFFAFGCGGDWECPVNAILYKEDDFVRMYVPEKGNFFNEKTRRAYGNEAGEEDMFEHAKYSRREQLKDIGRHFAARDPMYVAGKGAKAFESVRSQVEAGDADAVEALRRKVAAAVKSCDSGKLLKIYSLIQKED